MVCCTAEPFTLRCDRETLQHLISSLGVPMSLPDLLPLTGLHSAYSPLHMPLPDRGRQDLPPRSCQCHTGELLACRYYSCSDGVYFETTLGNTERWLRVHAARKRHSTSLFSCCSFVETTACGIFKCYIGKTTKST